jgi:hypothetical protein
MIARPRWVVWQMRLHLVAAGISLVMWVFSCDEADRGERPPNGSVVVQYDVLSQPMGCWELHDVPGQSLYGLQLELENGNRVVLNGGVVNWVRVRDDQWDEAYVSLGLTRERCLEVRSTIEWHERAGDGI